MTKFIQERRRFLAPSFGTGMMKGALGAGSSRQTRKNWGTFN